MSTLLFALAIEPLASAIRVSPQIVGLKHGLGKDKVSMYADDTLINLGDMDISLCQVMSLITRFGSLSGFYINWSKFVLLPLNAPVSFLPAIPYELKILA